MTRQLLIFLGVTGALLAGCSDRGKKPHKVKTIEGIAQFIDLKNNDVAMLCRDEKGNEMTMHGTIREITEVSINGRDQRLEDVKVGDKITVTGYREGKGTDQKYVATKIVVTRPLESDWKTSSQPAAIGRRPVAKESGKSKP